MNHNATDRAAELERYAEIGKAVAATVSAVRDLVYIIRKETR